MRKAAFLFTALGVPLAACEKEVVGIGLPEGEGKLVIQCFMSPQDERLTAFVSRSRPVWSPSIPADTLVTNATVTLSNGVRTIRLPYSGYSGEYYYYQKDALNTPFDIIPGDSYMLKVTTPRGEVATALCTVPAALNIPITVSTDSAWDAYNQRYYYRMRVSWSDPPGRGNYYRVAGWQEEVTSFYQDGTPADRYTSPVDWEADETISDAGQDNQQLTSPCGNWLRFGSGLSPPIFIHASLLHTDEHYYRNHCSLRRARPKPDQPVCRAGAGLLQRKGQPGRVGRLCPDDHLRTHQMTSTTAGRGAG
jgi:hypothetical protein